MRVLATDAVMLAIAVEVSERRSAVAGSGDDGEGILVVVHPLEIKRFRRSHVLKV